MAAPSVWNSLPAGIRACSSPHTFPLPVSIRPSVPPIGSHKCFRFGLWSTLRTLKDFIYLLTYLLTYLLIVVLDGGVVPFMHETGSERHYKVIIKIRAKMRFESALKRMQTVCMTNCCWRTVPHDWPSHRESSVAKFRRRTCDRIVCTGIGR